MAKTFKVPDVLNPPKSYCGGCGHGLAARILAECLEEMGLCERAILCVGIGCYSSVGSLIGCDSIDVPHGRAPAVATGIKRLRKDNVLVTYQGDGDICAIGCSEIVHAAARNEKITSIFVNNGVYGMTGGQMAPTTLPNQVTTTTRKGRNPLQSGMPLKLPEMLSGMPVAYIARGSLHNAKEILKTKSYIRKALEVQLSGEGFSMVEIMSPCPTNWHLDPCASMDRIENEVLRYYPLGEIVKGGGI